MAEVESRSVTLEGGGGERLAGRLYGSGGPAALVCGSWTTVKEQMAGLYARSLAEAGMTTLAFDFTGWGESGGEPRDRESPAAKAADIDAAARWLAGEAGVPAVGGLAICASAGYMAQAVAGGAPIASLVTVAAWLHDRGTVGEMYGGEEGLAERRRDGEAALEAWRETGEARTVPAYSPDDPRAAMGEAVKDYYGDPARGAVPEWPNRLAVMSWPEWLGYDALAAAPRVLAPTLMVHSEAAAFPGNARRFAAALGGPVEVAWREGTQIDFYHAAPQVGEAVALAVGHFRRTLGEGRP